MPMTHERVIAWFLTVANPILDGLRPIEHYLGNRRWTWRYRTGFFEVLYPPGALVSVRYLPNYEDFLSEHPQIASLASTYDEVLRQLARACREVHQALVADAEFVRAVEAAEADYPKALESYSQKGRFSREWWGALPPDEKVHLVAERVVNNVDVDLDGYNTDALFWNSFRDRFLAFRDREGHRERFQNMYAPGDAALAAGRALASALKTVRSTLARAYGVPPVPLE